MDTIFAQASYNSIAKPTIPTPSSSGSDQVLKQKAQEFETGFLRTMLSTMMDTVADDSLTGQSFAKDSYNDMLVEEFAKEISEVGGIGLADHVYRELLSAQEA